MFNNGFYYSATTILTGMVVILILCVMVYIYQRTSRDFKSETEKERPQSVVGLAQVLLIVMALMGFALGMLLSSFIESFTKLMLLTSINDNLFVV